MPVFSQGPRTLPIVPSKLSARRGPTQLLQTVFPDLEPNITTRSKIPDGDANDSLSAPELQDLELDLANDAAF